MGLFFSGDFGKASLLVLTQCCVEVEKNKNRITVQ